MMDLVKELNSLFNLGQTYWQQADSEYAVNHRNSDATHEKARSKMAELAKYVRDIRQERDDLRQQLEEIKIQLPVSRLLEDLDPVTGSSYEYFEIFQKIEPGTKLYAKPLPAEPAVAVSDDIYKKVSVWYARLTGADAVTDDGEHVGYCCTMKMMDEMEEILSAAQSHIQQSAERITEQDAREIVNSFRKWFSKPHKGYPAIITNHDEQVWPVYFNENGRALVDNINGRCPRHESDQSPATEG